MAQKPMLYQYKLSIEELVLILYTINCGKTAEVLLRRAYDEIPEDQLSNLLTAGRNSLLARDYAKLVEYDFPKVPIELQKTVFPISVFDTLVELYDDRAERGFFLQMFHHPKYGFTVQQNQNHVVFNLTHANTPSLLGPFMADLFDHVGGEVGSELLDRDSLNFSLKELQDWIGVEPKQSKTAMMKKGLPQAQAEMLAEDLVAIRGLGSISISP